MLRETRDKICAAELVLMKPTPIIINTARGGMVNEAVLREALKWGSITAAGLDMMYPESPDPNDLLPKLDNTITPHTRAVR